MKMHWCKVSWDKYYLPVRLRLERVLKISVVKFWCLHFTQLEKLIVDLATLQIIDSPKEVEFESNSAKDSFEVNLGAEMAKLVALSLSQRKVLLSFLQKEISQRFVLWTLSLYFHSQYSFLQRSIQDYCFRKKLIFH